MLKRVAVLVLLSTLAAAWYLALPPRVRSAPGTGPRDPVRGVIHVHTRRSDGTGTVDDVAAAAARAGLNFVVLTDHGDATREPDPPRYRSGVLCIDAVEISTFNGHIVALGLPASPYPLGGEARDVVEDIARLGGISIAAHPGSARQELQFSDWSVPIDSLEWLNGDSEWRDEPVWSLWRALMTYPFRKTETLTSLLDRPSDVLRHWDMLTQDRRVVAIAGSDAHARIGLRTLGEPYDSAASFQLPAYDQMFRVFSNSLDGVTLTGDAAKDAEAVIGAVRLGHVYSTIDGVGGPATLSFTATNAAGRASAGDAIDNDGPTTFHVDVDAPSDAKIDLIRNGVVNATAGGATLDRVADGNSSPAVYRVEVSLPGAPGQPEVPWIVSNPIYLGRVKDAVPPRVSARPGPTATAVKYGDGPADAWSIEKNSASLGAIDVAPAVRGTQLAIRYALGGTASSGPYAAFAMRAGELATFDRLIFTARADHPARMSVQLRQPGGPNGQRWSRSVYIDPMPREITVFFDDLKPVDASVTGRPDLDTVESVLFVFDTVNTALGGRGQIWIDDVKYGR